jgi:hypothetical protein
MGYVERWPMSGRRVGRKCEREPQPGAVGSPADPFLQEAPRTTLPEWILDVFADLGSRDGVVAPRSLETTYALEV